MSDKAQQPAPCPICGNAPEVSYGLSDAPFSTPLVTCPTIHIKGDITSRCPMHADGIAAWNYICEGARKSRADHARAEAAEAKLAVAVEGLNFYANLPHEWIVTAGPGHRYGSTHLLGERARATLAQIQKEGTDNGN